MPFQRFGLLCLFILISDSLFAQIRHTRVTWHENPSQEAIISWTSDEIDEDAKVYYDLGPASGKLQFERGVFAQGRYTRGVFRRGPVYNHVHLTGLTPSTDYYFEIQASYGTSQKLWFRTAPKEGDDFRLILGGDSRSDPEQRIKMNLVMKSSIERDEGILALVHGGDYVMNGTSWSEWSEWLRHHEITTSESGRLLPIIPTRGNHEYSQRIFNEVWAWPNDGLGYFSSEIGDLALLILNTEVSVHGEQKTWLKDQLKSLRPQKKWVVANYHRPAYPAVKRPANSKAAWVPLFEEFSIDLAVESDGHVYKQTAPLYKDKIDLERGIIYVGEGGLGVKQRTPASDRWYLNHESAFSTSAHHIQILSISENQMIFEGLDENLKGLSSFSLQPRN